MSMKTLTTDEMKLIAGGAAQLRSGGDFLTRLLRLLITDFFGGEGQQKTKLQ
jgi:bacteriocin-like protein